MKLKSRLASAALTAVMLAGNVFAPFGTTAAADIPYTDVPNKSWYYEAVKTMYDSKIMNGMSETEFGPKLELTRAMFVTILGRLTGVSDKDLTETKDFKDVPSGKWYSGYVGWAVKNGVVHGYEDGTFKPEDNLTRQEMAVAVANFVDVFGYNLTKEGGMFEFEDQDTVGSWAVDSLGVLRDTGVIQGDDYGCFNPKNNITRAEAATVMMKLKNAIENAWQGYLPEASDNSVVLGASYLFYEGSACSGGMEHKLDRDGNYPVLNAYMDSVAASRTYLAANTIGVSLSYMNIDIGTHPIVKICYSSDDIGSSKPGVTYIANWSKSESAQSSTIYEAFTLKDGADDCGMKTATADLSSISKNGEYSFYNASWSLQNLVFSPCEADYDGDGTFKIAYIAFFKSQADADAFSAKSDSEINDYLKNYDRYSSLDYASLSESEYDSYSRELSERISDIKNSESAVTPEQITAAGGKCYYLSSINGDDSNSGTSPDKPWKSLSKLYKVIDIVYIPVVKEGDAVFFERGSVWYPEEYKNYQVYCLHGFDGVTYGAYGEGDKPLFTCALDFTSADNTGRWTETEWKNVWELDPELIDKDPEWRGAEPHGTDIGNIYFNGGEALGVRIVPTDDADPFGEGKVSYDKGYVCNGYEYYEAGVADMTNPGTALTKNLEFIHDRNEGRLYLYWDNGNPGDYFDDIKVTRNGHAGAMGKNSRIDNLAFLYSTNYAMTAGGNDLMVTNCEIGCSGGSLISVDSGIECYGESNGVKIYNCYIHDVGDGSLTNQSVGIESKTEHLQNIEYAGNVMAAVGFGAEIWMHPVVIDENGYGRNRMINISVHDNFMAYIGYGMTQMQATTHNIGGSCINGSIYGEMSNCTVENNIYFFINGNINEAYFATYEQNRGWMSKGNTYIFNPDYACIGMCYETINKIDHYMWKRCRISFPATYEGLVWYTQQGVDPTGTYRYTTETNQHEQNKCFFTTGYWVEHGGFKLK